MSDRGGSGAPPAPAAATRSTGPALPGADWGIGTVVLFAALLYVGARLLPVFATLLGALLYAALLSPLVAWLERLPLGKRTVGRRAASAAAVLASLLALTSIVAVASPLLWKQGMRLLGNFPEILQTALKQLRVLAHDRLRLGSEFEASFDTEVNRLLADGAHSLANWLVGFASGLFDLLGLIVVPLGAFYLLVDGAYLRDLLLDLAPSGWRARAREVLDQSGVVLAAWVRGQSIVCLAAATLYSALFALLGLPYWFAIGVFAGLLEVVPYLGSILVVVVISIVGLSDDFGVALRSVIAYIVGNQIVNYVISPRFLSSALDLHPFVVVLAVLAGGTLGGPGGAVLAIPIVAILNALTRRLGHPKGSPSGRTPAA